MYGKMSGGMRRVDDSVEDSPAKEVEYSREGHVPRGVEQDRICFFNEGGRK